ncbi:MAG: carbohydrate porin [Bdellovibrionales bacterium]|nr:carbohydrate porin [Bdellovibrionales bacterium]
MKRKSGSVSLFVVLFLGVSTFPGSARADAGGLLGDWGGAKTAMAERGVEVETILTGDVVGNAVGGLERDTTVLGNLDIAATLDTGKAGWWENGTVFIYFLGNTGDPASEFIGDLQVTSNIEAPETLKLYEAWYDHSFADGSVSLLVGLHDYNSEFDVISSAGTLLNSSFGIGPDISQVGPSIFPTTAVAARLKVALPGDLYGLAAVYDGVPGSPNNPRGTHIQFGSDDGLFWAGELGAVGVEGSGYYKASMGLWGHSAEVEDFSEQVRDRNSGLYLLGERRVFTESEDETQGLVLFGRVGFARESRNAVSHYFGAGLSYLGLFEGRDADTLALGVARAELSDDYRVVTPESTDAETAIELNYRIAVSDFFAITPDVTVVLDPGASRGVDDAVVLTVRTELAL